MCQNNQCSSGALGCDDSCTASWKKCYMEAQGCKAYGTVNGATATEVNKAPVDTMTVLANETRTASTEKPDTGLSKLFSGSLLENFAVDNSTYCVAQIRATFYPKFENEKSDQEIRTRMIEMVSKGLATLEVSLKHSGSLFMYAGHEGGAYARNSYGNM